MPAAKDSYREDFEWVQQCLRGDEAAVRRLHQHFHHRLTAQLIGRGASETEALDLLGDLWAECIMGRLGKPPLFEKYHGKCGVYTWLVTVATHRLVDLKRRQRFHGELPASPDDQEDRANFDRLPAPRLPLPDVSLKVLMRSALSYVIRELPPEEYLLLHLVYIHGVMQREAAQMFGWHESKVSRTLDATMQRIATRTMEQIRLTDPWLDLSWEDFVELCAHIDVLRGL